MPGPLAGLRVVDFGQYLAGPLAAVLLADQGAEVIHVDPPGGPRLAGVADAFYNRGKRRVILDLKTPEGVAAARRLVGTSDVVIENFRPGVLARLGVDLADLRAGNPALITCSLPGFAASDPRAGMRAFEGILDAATANCEPRNGEEPPGWDWSRPSYSALPLASHFAGYLAAVSVVMALIARRRTGAGQAVEVPLFDAMFTLVGHSGAYKAAAGPHAPAPIHGRGAGAFRCADGRHVQFDTSAPRHLAWFARAAGVLDSFDPELLDVAANAAPEVNARLHARLRELFATRTAAQWEETGGSAGAAIGFIRTPAEWLATEHARASGAAATVTDPEFGPMSCTGLPVRLAAFDNAPAPRRLPGADTDAVLAELGQLTPRPVESGGEAGLAQPLSGLKVLDVGVALAGPTCGRILAEFGAEVLKIYPPSAPSGGYLNRGKQSLLADLSTVGAQGIYWRLIDSADVVVENFSPGTADRLGLGYGQVRARRPELVYTSVSAYGLGGPWTQRRGWERQGQAVTGIMDRTGLPSVLGPYNIVDIGTGTLAAFGTALALYDRLSTGRGQLVSASLAQTGTIHQAPFMFDFPGYVASEPRGYEALGESPLQRFYQAADKWFFLAARTGDTTALAQVTGIRDLAQLTGPALASTLEQAFAGSAAEVWTGKLTAAGIAAHVVVSIGELMSDESARSRGLSITQEVGGAGECVMPGVSPRLSVTPALPGSPPVQPGSDAERVLASVGMADRVAALDRGRVIRATDLPPAWP